MTPETSQLRENNLDSSSTQRSITRTNTRAEGRWLSAIAVLAALSAIACGSASVASPGQEEALAAQDNRREIVLAESSIGSLKALRKRLTLGHEVRPGLYGTLPPPRMFRQ